MHETANYRAWLERINRSDNTVRAYVSKVDSYLASGMTATGWLNDAKINGASPSTIKSMLAAIKSYNKFAGIVDQEILEYNPPMVRPPAPHPLPGGLADVRMALAAVTHAPHRSAIALGAFAGCRVDESISLTKDDIHGNTLVIKGKGTKIREVPISLELKGYLEIIETHRLVPISNASARKGITAAFKRVGISGMNGKAVSSHDLRATFATAVYRKTGDALIVQRLLGHSSITDTQRYIGVDKSDMEKAVVL